MKKPVPFGKYVLLDRINVGGMAEVFKAKSSGVEGFEKLVALKRILPNIAENDDFITMFIDEAKIAVQLSHANIAQIFELGKQGDSYFIAMEYVHGLDMRTMFERLRSRGETLPIPATVFVLGQVCEALDYAHRRTDAHGRPLGIVHRDVSPQNVLVSFEGDVKVIDFGIAKAANKASRTQAGILKGKFGYMSPEQVRGLPLDRRSDVFALGTVLYELLTGQRLFVAESDFATLEKVRKAEIPPPSALDRRIPAELDRIALRALERDPDRRYAWASEMGLALQRFLMGTGQLYTRSDLSTLMKRAFAQEYGGGAARGGGVPANAGEAHEELAVHRAPASLGAPAGLGADAETPTRGLPPARGGPPGPERAGPGGVWARSGDERAPDAEAPLEPRAWSAPRATPEAARPGPPPLAAAAPKSDDPGPPFVTASAVAVPPPLPAVVIAAPSPPPLPPLGGRLPPLLGPGPSVGAAAAAVGAGPPPLSSGRPPALPGAAPAPAASVAATPLAPLLAGLGLDLTPVPAGAGAGGGRIATPLAASAPPPLPLAADDATPAIPQSRTLGPTEHTAASPFPEAPHAAAGFDARSGALGPDDRTRNAPAPTGPGMEGSSRGARGSGVSAVGLRAYAGRLPRWAVPAASVAALSAAAAALAFNLRAAHDSPADGAPPALLDIVSKPEGAHVEMDGTILGTRTPTRVELAPGVHAVRLRKDGFKPFEQQIDAKAPETAEGEGPNAAAAVARVEATLIEEEGTGTLAIQSIPQGARVQVDGELRGETPATVTGLASARDHVVVVDQVGFHPWQRTVTLQRGAVLALSAELAPLEATLLLTSRPVGARVFLDGERRGSTPTALKGLRTNGTYRVRLEKAGHKPWEERVPMNGKVEETLTVTLDRAGGRGAPDRDDEPAAGGRSSRAAATGGGAGDEPGILRVNSTPWAEVWIDGRDTGHTTPLLKLPLAPGPHKVTLKNPRYGCEETYAVDVRPGDSTSLFKKLDCPRAP